MKPLLHGGLGPASITQPAAASDAEMGEGAGGCADLGGDALALSPVDFGKFIADETGKWAKVIELAGIKPE
jgi:hypothetical protein